MLLISLFPTMAYTGRHSMKVLPFPGFKCLQVEVYESQGRIICHKGLQKYFEQTYLKAVSFNLLSTT